MNLMTMMYLTVDQENDVIGFKELLIRIAYHTPKTYNSNFIYIKYNWPNCNHTQNH